MADDSELVLLGLVQMKCSVDPRENLEVAVTRIHEAAAMGAQIVCLQELFRSQYFCQSEETDRFDLAEEIPGPSTDVLSRIARELDIVIVASLFEKRAEGVFHNTAVVLNADGSILGRYRKMHIPEDPLYYEKYYFSPGDLGFRTFKTKYGKVGTLVCWDQWFPEAARLTALSGAEFLLYPTAIGWHPQEKSEFGEAQSAAWEIMQRAHAIANGLFVAAVNRVGLEGNLEFWGGSFVADPFGRILAKGSSDHEEILVVPCNRRLIRETRRNWPFFRDRRIDAYGDIQRRFIDSSKG